MRHPLRLLAVLAVLAPLTVGCVTVHGADRTARTGPADAAQPIPVERPSIPSPSPLLRGSDPVKPSTQEAQQDHRQEHEHQPMRPEPQPPAPAPASTAEPPAARRAAPQVPQLRQETTSSAPQPRMSEPPANVQPADLCRWGQRAGAVDGRLAQLCRRTYG